MYIYIDGDEIEIEKWPLNNTEWLRAADPPESWKSAYAYNQPSFSRPPVCGSASIDSTKHGSCNTVVNLLLKKIMYKWTPASSKACCSRVSCMCMHECLCLHTCLIIHIFFCLKSTFFQCALNSIPSLLTDSVLLPIFHSQHITKCLLYSRYYSAARISSYSHHNLSRLAFLPEFCRERNSHNEVNTIQMVNGTTDIWNQVILTPGHFFSCSFIFCVAYFLHYNIGSLKAGILSLWSTCRNAKRTVGVES